MSTTTYYPTELTDTVAAQAQTAQTQSRFDTIAANMATSTGTDPFATAAPKKKRYITVLVHMPHVAKYGKDSTMSLTYGCSFDVKIGDTVLCPPTPLHSKWTKGMVTDLTGTGYRGRVKYVAKIGAKTSKQKVGVQ